MARTLGRRTGTRLKRRWNRTAPAWPASLRPARYRRKTSRARLGRASIL